jgi:hypothetical protein
MSKLTFSVSQTGEGKRLLADLFIPMSESFETLVKFWVPTEGNESSQLSSSFSSFPVLPLRSLSNFSLRYFSSSFCPS